MKLRKTDRPVHLKFATPKYNRFKKWYGVIDFENNQPSQFMEYESRFRSEAVRVFRKKAEKLGGKLGQVGVL